jgi:hypothetical protein
MLEIEAVLRDVRRKESALCGKENGTSEICYSCNRGR